MKAVSKFKRILIIFLCAVLVLGAIALIINAHVVNSTKKSILTSEEAAALKDVDCILVLGCLVKENGIPSHMLRDRLEKGLELYGLGAAPKLLMSGDHGQKDYNEVQTMKDFALDRGVASEDIFMDHAGFSTYDSIYRAKAIFGAEKIIIVTQGYHLPRALYIAESLGVEAYGVASDYHTYAGQAYRDMREILARNKDFIYTVFKPEPKYLGDAIPINGDGNLTND